MWEQPSKADRKRWAAEDEMSSVHREAWQENRKRDWVAQAAREDRCHACGNSPASRCRDANSCSEAVAESLERRRREDPGDGCGARPTERWC